MVADEVDAISIYFSGDSQSLVFMNDVNGCGVGKLKAANADGTNVRLVHGAASDDVGVGETVFFVTPNDDGYLAAPMAGGKTVSIGKASSVLNGPSAQNATGTAFAYTSYKDSGGSSVPDFVSFAAWLGSVAVYGTGPFAGATTSISTLTNASAAPTLLAGQVKTYAWAPIVAATRLFYAREVETAYGPVGVFAVDLPR